MHTLIRSSRTRAGRIALIAATAAVATALLGPAGLSAATTPITFDMTIYGHCISGWTGGADVNLVWRDSTGALKAQGTPTNQSYSWWEFCPTDDTLTVVPGDQIKVTTADATRKYVVPNLTLTLDRVNDRATGTGPAGRTIRLCSSWSWYLWDECHSVRVGQDGKWSFDPNVDILGGYEAEITWKSPKGDRLFEMAYAPRLGVTLGEPSFTGWTHHLGEVSVSTDGSSDGVGHATADRSGFFAGLLRDSNSHEVPFAPGDHVTAPAVANDADWILPAISGSANKRTEVVRGACLNATGVDRVRVWIVGPLGTVRGAGFWNIHADGSFKATFVNYFAGGDVPATTNIKSGNEVRIDCIQSTGDFTRLSFVVP